MHEPNRHPLLTPLVCDHFSFTFITVSSVFNLQTVPDVTMRPDMSKYKFWKKRVSFHYSEGGNRIKKVYHVIQSQATPLKNIKSTKSGKVALTFNWKDCGAWVRIKSST